jgi:hypothetical protein
MDPRDDCGPAKLFLFRSACSGQWGVNLGQTVFAQLMEHLPRYEFQKCEAAIKAMRV